MSAKKFYPCEEEREGYVKLGDGFYFTADDDQYILCRLGRKNKTDIKTKKYLDEMIDVNETIGFYQSLHGFIKDCMTHEIRQGLSMGTIKELHDVIKKIDEFEKCITEAVKGY